MRRAQWNKTQRKEFLLRASVTVTALGASVTAEGFAYSFVLPTPFGNLYLEPENSKFFSQVLCRFEEPMNPVGYIAAQGGLPYYGTNGKWNWQWVHAGHTPQTATAEFGTALRELLFVSLAVHAIGDEPERKGREVPPWLKIVGGLSEETKT